MCPRQESRIAYLGSEKPRGDFGYEYDGKGKLLMPGFYNSHAHSPMVLMRGYIGGKTSACRTG